MAYKAKDMARLAARVKGVLEVNNQLSELPVSIHDDQLRRSIARQIYRDPVFSRYAIHVNPPIHIIVERGNVTLTGAVNSTLERPEGGDHRATDVRRVRSREPAADRFLTGSRISASGASIATDAPLSATRPASAPATHTRIRSPQTQLCR